MYLLDMVSVYTQDATLTALGPAQIWNLVNDQRDAQFFTMYLFLFLFLTLYMFRAHRAHHQEGQIVSTQPLVTVTLFTVGGRVQVGSVCTSRHSLTPPTPLPQRDVILRQNTSDVHNQTLN
jgi:hypothetical protein